MAPIAIAIHDHTTASSPRPHVLYSVEVTTNEKHTIVNRRYSEFVELQNALGIKDVSLPPKRLLSTIFVPSAWVDDQLIAERKAGLAQYLSNVLRYQDYESSPVLQQFLTMSGPGFDRPFDYEDALPSTLTREAALQLKSQSLDMATREVTTEATPLIAAAYYPDWSATTNPPEKINFSKYDILFYAFATPNSSSTLTWDYGSQAILKRLVAAAKSSGKGTKIVLSVGGWSGSYWFNQATKTSANRTTFSAALASAVCTYGLDGIDIDWEFPDDAGAGNPYSSKDAANLLSLLKLLRTALGTKAIISAAVQHLPWNGSDGNPLTDVSAYAKLMTYVNIMNYDVWGASSTPGPNAPLGDLCGTSKQPQANAQAALKQWVAAGFPASKLLLGLPLYGYVSKSTKTALTGSFMPSELAQTNADAEAQKTRAHSRKTVPDVQIATTTANLQSWWGQQIPFSSIVAAGALVKTGANYAQNGGFTMAWDDCSDTPFLYNVSQQTVVTYDDTYSLGDKALFAKKSGMAGCFTWSLDMDDGVTLQNVIRAKLGLS